jgi:hypothetical protein
MDTGIEIFLWLGLGLLIVEVSRSHSDTPHSVWLPWKSDQPVADTSTWQHQQNRLTSMPTAGSELAIPARERPKTQALECAAAGIGRYWELLTVNTSRIANEMSRCCLCLWYRAVTSRVPYTKPKLYTNYVRHTTCIFSVTLLSRKEV